MTWLADHYRFTVRSLRLHARQAALVTLAIGLCVFSLSLVLNVRLLLQGALDRSAALNQPPDAVFYPGSLPPAHLEALRRLEGVRSAVGWKQAAFRYQFAEEIWYALDLTATSAPPEGAQSMGAFLDDPAGEAVYILLERSARDLTAARPGDIALLFNGASEQPVVVWGLVAAPQELPSRLRGNEISGYTSLAQLNRLQGEAPAAGYTRLLLHLEPGLSPSARRQTLQRVSDWLQANDFSSSYQALDAGDARPHPLQFVLDAAALLLALIAGLSFLLSAIWAGGVMLSWMSAERRQIGVLKTLGFAWTSILLRYMAQALVLGGGACLFSIPLAAAAARGLAGRVASSLYLDLPPASLSFTALPAGLGIGLLLPLLVAGASAWQSCRLTVTQALRPGPALTFSARQAIMMLRPALGTAWLQYAVCSLLRQPRRLWFSLLTLAAAGAIFITLASLSGSIRQTMQSAALYWQEDVQFTLPLMAGRFAVLNELHSLDAVQETNIEARLALPAEVAPGQGEAELVMVGLPPETSNLSPTLLAGRWLLPDEQDGLVVDAEVTRRLPGLAPGSTLELEIEGRTLRWQVVGIVSGQLIGYDRFQAPVVYARYFYLSESLGLGGQANQYLLRFSAANNQPASAQEPRAVVREIETHLHAFGLSPHWLEYRHARLKLLDDVFSLLNLLVGILLLLFLLIGSLSLVNWLALNRQEQAPEMTILLALGATRRWLGRLMALQGLIAGGLGAALAALLAAPLTLLACRQLGGALLNHPLVFTFSLAAAVTWLLICLVLGVLSSPAPLLPPHSSRAL